MVTVRACCRSSPRWRNFRPIGVACSKRWLKPCTGSRCGSWCRARPWPPRASTRRISPPACVRSRAAVVPDGAQRPPRPVPGAEPARRFRNGGAADAGIPPGRCGGPGYRHGRGRRGATWPGHGRRRQCRTRRCCGRSRDHPAAQCHCNAAAAEPPGYRCTRARRPGRSTAMGGRRAGTHDASDAGNGDGAAACRRTAGFRIDLRRHRRPHRRCRTVAGADCACAIVRSSRQLAAHAAFVSHREDVLRLALDPGFEYLRSERSLGELAQALQPAPRAGA